MWVYLQVATECIINIRTVATLTKERKFWTDYSQLIEKPYRYAAHVRYQIVTDKFADK